MKRWLIGIAMMLVWPGVAVASQINETGTASGPGQWDFVLSKAGYNSNCSFSIVAQ